MTKPSITNQELFDKIYTHLLKQNEKSYIPEFDECAYRQVISDEKINKCAIGCIIPDNLYDPDIEGYSLRGIISFYPNVIPFDLTECDIFLLTHLQRIHDNAPPELWKELLTECAEKFGLRITEKLKNILV